MAKSTGKRSHGKRVTGWGLLAVVVAIFVAGLTIGRRRYEWDGYMVPREVVVTVIDAQGEPVSDARVVRVQVDGPPVPPSGDPFYHTECNEDGELAFGLGARGGSGGGREYFWGLYKTRRDDNPSYDYRILRGDREIARLRTRDLYADRNIESTPIKASVFASLRGTPQLPADCNIDLVRVTVTMDEASNPEL